MGKDKLPIYRIEYNKEQDMILDYVSGIDEEIPLYDHTIQKNSTSISFQIVTDRETDIYLICEGKTDGDEFDFDKIFIAGKLVAVKEVNSRIFVSIKLNGNDYHHSFYIQDEIRDTARTVLKLNSYMSVLQKEKQNESGCYDKKQIDIALKLFRKRVVKLNIAYTFFQDFEKRFYSYGVEGIKEYFSNGKETIVRNYKGNQTELARDFLKYYTENGKEYASREKAEEWFIKQYTLDGKPINRNSFKTTVADIFRKAR